MPTRATVRDRVRIDRQSKHLERKADIKVERQAKRQTERQMYMYYMIDIDIDR